MQYIYTMFGNFSRTRISDRVGFQISCTVAMLVVSVLIMTPNTENESPDLGPECRQSRRDWLSSHRETVRRSHVLYQGLEDHWSWLRLITFATGVMAVVLVRHELVLAIMTGCLALLGFYCVVLRHASWKDRRESAERVLAVIDESLHVSTECDRPVRSWNRPEDPADASVSLPSIIEWGPAWLLTDQERDDLDLYGPPVVIFGLLNRTSRTWGHGGFATSWTPRCFQQTPSSSVNRQFSGWTGTTTNASASWPQPCRYAVDPGIWTDWLGFSIGPTTRQPRPCQRASRSGPCAAGSSVASWSSRS
jgi:hypothetical protein